MASATGGLTSRPVRKPFGRLLCREQSGESSPGGGEDEAAASADEAVEEGAGYEADEQALELEIINDGAGHANGDSPPAGRGLIGMRERAALVGGEFEAGYRNGGHYRVWAQLPLAPPS
jgi:hypothetical protein